MKLKVQPFNQKITKQGLVTHLTRMRANDKKIVALLFKTSNEVHREVLKLGKIETMSDSQKKIAGQRLKSKIKTIQDNFWKEFSLIVKKESDANKQLAADQALKIFETLLSGLNGKG